MTIQQYEQQLLLDALYCEEEKWDDDENDAGDVLEEENPSFPPVLLFEQGLFWEDDDLLSLFSKETENQPARFDVRTDESLIQARREAVDWIVKVNVHYGFTTLTAVLSVNYLDRFLTSFQFQKDKPWMIQLLAVTCLSLAAKVEETQVPLLLDLQVVETKYIFEAKTIQRMELLILSTLKWNMHPVTPLSFLDHIIRRLGLKIHLHWEFLKRCERLLLCVISDSRSVLYLPSVLATATMLHVTDQVELFNLIDYQNQLLCVLKKSKEEVNECYNLILQISTIPQSNNPRKRKLEKGVPSSPSGVIDGAFDSDSSNDSWGTVYVPEPPFKKNRAREQLLLLKPKRYGVEHKENLTGKGNEFIYHSKGHSLNPGQRNWTRYQTWEPTKAE